MRKKKKIKSEIEKKYYKERKLVWQRISRAKKRGFVVPEKLLPAIPKKITAGSIRRLKKLSAKYIQEKSEYKGKKGAEARKEYQKEFTKKRKIAKLENKMKLLIQLLIERGYFENDLKNKDEKELEELLQITSGSREPVPDEIDEPDFEEGGYGGFDLPDESELVYQEIIRMLSDPSGNRLQSNIALNFLNSEIEKRGFNDVMRTINESPDELKDDAHTIAYVSDGRQGQDQIQTALNEFIVLISGRALSQKEAEEISEQYAESYFNQKTELSYF